MKKESINQIRIAIQEYYSLASNDENDCVDALNIYAHNKCFEILEEKFGWNIDAEENVKAMQYISRATDIEIAEYLFDHVFIDIILHEESRKLMEELDMIWGFGIMSLDEYFSEMKKSGDLIMPSEDEAINYILNQFEEKIK